MRLMRHIARPSVAFRYGQRFHEMPPGEVGAPDVADLAAACQVIQSAQRLLDRRRRIEAVHVVDVDVVGAQAPEAVFDRAQQRLPRRAGIVRPWPHRERALRRDQHLVAAAGQRAAEHFLRPAAGIHVGGVEAVDPGLQTDIDEPPRLRPLGRAPLLEELPDTPEGCRTETEHRDTQSRAAELPVLHAILHSPKCSVTNGSAAAQPPAAGDRRADSCGTQQPSANLGS